MIRSLRLSSLLAAMLLLSGCALFKWKTPAQRRAEQQRALERARQPSLVGKITLVKEAEQFVLIDAPSLPTPKAGTVWRTYSGTSQTGELRATGVRRRPWVIADITNGNPQAGDTVLQPAPVEATTTPPRAAPATAQPTPVPTAPAKAPPFWKRWLRGIGLGK